MADPQNSKDTKDYSDAMLIQYARNGHREAFSAFLERHYEFFYRIGWFLAGSEGDASAIAQNVCCALVTEIDQFQDKDLVPTWLALLTLQCTRAEPPSETFRSDKQWQASLLARLKDEQREAVALIADENLSTTHVALILGITENAIQGYLNGVRKLLRLGDTDAIELPQAPRSSKMARANAFQAALELYDEEYSLRELQEKPLNRAHGAGGQPDINSERQETRRSSDLSTIEQANYGRGTKQPQSSPSQQGSLVPPVTFSSSKFTSGVRPHFGLRMMSRLEPKLSRPPHQSDNFFTRNRRVLVLLLLIFGIGLGGLLLKPSLPSKAQQQAELTATKEAKDIEFDASRDTTSEVAGNNSSLTALANVQDEPQNITSTPLYRLPETVQGNALSTQREAEPKKSMGQRIANWFKGTNEPEKNSTLGTPSSTPHADTDKLTETRADTQERMIKNKPNNVQSSQPVLKKPAGSVVQKDIFDRRGQSQSRIPGSRSSGENRWYGRQARSPTQAQTTNRVQSVARRVYEGGNSNIPQRHDTEREPFSTFSLDANTLSYRTMRTKLVQNQMPNPEHIRPEEFLNYFPYDYPRAESEKNPFKISTSVVPSPWVRGRKLIHIGIKGYEVALIKRDRANLVFLVDTSRSMAAENRLPLLRQVLMSLVEELDSDAILGIVTYSGASRIVLEPTSVREKSKVLKRISELHTSDFSAGVPGLQTAYELVARNFDKNANNRVILISDGDFNVGTINLEEAKALIYQKRQQGVFLSVLGLNMDDYNETVMQNLADNGNGVAAYVDTLSEARKVLLQEAIFVPQSIAKNVAIQIEFNPQMVVDYRLVGYETDEMGRSNEIVSGTLRSGHTVTAIYEFTPRHFEAGAGATMRIDEYALVKMRYKLPESDTDTQLESVVSRREEYASLNAAPNEVRFAIAVATFAKILKEGQSSSFLSFDDIIRIAQEAQGNDPFGYRAEFIQLVQAAKTARKM